MVLKSSIKDRAKPTDYMGVMTLANVSLVKAHPGVWQVLSSDRTKTYEVARKKRRWSCTCPFYTKRRKRRMCKHIRMVRNSINRKRARAWLYSPSGGYAFPVLFLTLKSLRQKTWGGRFKKVLIGASALEDLKRETKRQEGTEEEMWCVTTDPSSPTGLVTFASGGPMVKLTDETLAEVRALFGIV